MPCWPMKCLIYDSFCGQTRRVRKNSDKMITFVTNFHKSATIECEINEFWNERQSSYNKINVHFRSLHSLHTKILSQGAFVTFVIYEEMFCRYFGIDFGFTKLYFVLVKVSHLFNSVKSHPFDFRHERTRVGLGLVKRSKLTIGIKENVG